MVSFLIPFGRKLSMYNFKSEVTIEVSSFPQDSSRRKLVQRFSLIEWKPRKSIQQFFFGGLEEQLTVITDGVDHELIIGDPARFQTKFRQVKLWLSVNVYHFPIMNRFYRVSHDLHPGSLWYLELIMLLSIEFLVVYSMLDFIFFLRLKTRVFSKRQEENEGEESDCFWEIHLFLQRL